ncbi:MAG: Sec-independent protein translocase protein TatB [Gammaproteobacteria bacterium]|jgi:sec-independent protein translocase protein TatB|nr:Sec-independent protein translocase protein TatB [Gammaproteobacteria bacterium]
MFDVGFTEIVLIGIIGLIVLGPERLPVAARTVGKWVGKIKRTVGGVQREIQQELRLEEIRHKAQANREAIKDRMDELRQETELMEAPVTPATFDNSAQDGDHDTGDARPLGDSAEQESSSAETTHAEESKQQGYQ